MTTGYSSVYFIQAAPEWPIKIGLTYNVSRRLSSLRMNSGLDLKVLGIMRDGSRDMETMIHRRFKEHRIVGEWFKPVGDLLKYIEKNSRPWEGSVRRRASHRADYLPPLDDGIESFPSLPLMSGACRVMTDAERRLIQDEEIADMERAGYERWRIAAVTGLSEGQVVRRIAAKAR